MHFVQTGQRQILLDCGKNIGQDLNAATKPQGYNRPSHRGFPFHPGDIDLVLLSHAHIDHCGSLPLLVKQGFRGSILCTEATRDLIEIVLYDTARIHERETDRDRYYVGGDHPVERTHRFSYEDVDRTLELCQGIEYEEWFAPFPDVKIRLADSAHVLGSNLFEVHFNDGNNHPHRLVFTGDIGRLDYPFVGTPCKIPSADVIVCESTYGGRDHEPFRNTQEQLKTIVCETIGQGGKVLIPAFSLGRTNLLRCCLLELMKRNEIPSIPIYIDSPMAYEFDSVYNKHCTNGSAQVDSHGRVEWLENPEHAQLRTTERAPCIIIASGGMCEGGRILDHLREHIDDPRSALVLVSYQAPDTLGAQLMAPKPTARFHGRIWNKWIRVEQINGFSAHADQADLTSLLEQTDRQSKIRLVHGEAKEKQLLKGHLLNIGFANTEVPDLFDKVAF
jgi:metallo-beta-lactamase family protein